VRASSPASTGGRLYGAPGDDIDVGWWRITPDDSYCRAWNVFDGRRERCFVVNRDGETFDLQVRDRWGTVSLRRTAGNPSTIEALWSWSTRRSEPYT